MTFFKNFFGSKEKSISVPMGGFELLSKLVPSELNEVGLMERYKKSLYVFACISKIAEKVGSIDINLYKVKNSKGDIEEIKTHPALDLIYRPNDFQTKAEFLMTTIINKKTAGDAFWLKIRNNSGKVIELWNLRPDMMTIVSDPVKVVGGYVFNRGDGTRINFASEDIVHFKDYPDPTNTYRGISALMPASIRVQTEEYATKYQRNFFANNSRPDAVIKSPKILTKDQQTQLKKSWAKSHGGIKNSSKIGLLQGGMEYQLISITQKDMDYIEGLRLTRDDILVAFRMTKTVLGITDDVNRANAETAMAVFLSEVVAPEIKAIIEKANEEMAYIDFGENIFYGFNEPNLEDKEFKLKEDTELVKNNIFLINEVRESRGKPPIQGGWSIYMPIMQQAIGGLSSEDRTKMIQLIEKDSESNEKIIKASKVPQKYNFKGKFVLKQKMRILEAVAKQFVEKSTKKKKSSRPMIQDEEVRKIYADMVNKSIDTKTLKLKNAMDEFAIKQKARVVSNLEKKVKSFKRKFDIESLFNKKKEIDLSIDFILPYIEEFLYESGKESLLNIAPQENFTMNADRIKDFIQKRAKFFSESITNTTLTGLEKTLSEGISSGEGIVSLMERVESVYDDFPSYRSELIARTEATVANNEGILESFKQSDVVNGKEWISAEDSRVRPEHAMLDGEIRKNGETFSNGLQYPQEPNCRCVLGGAFIED